MSATGVQAHISDEKLADWSARWPSILPTSVPHEQVLMLIEDLRDARAKYERLAYRAECVVSDFEHRGTEKSDERLEHAVANLEVELKNGARS